MTEQNTNMQKYISGFLTSSPPGSTEQVSVIVYESNTGFNKRPELQLPDLDLHCDSERCNGIRSFRPSQRSLNPAEKTPSLYFITYICKNCGETQKTYAISLTLLDRKEAKVTKIGEMPPFGSPTPARLLRILDSEKEYFLKGRRSENHSLGIGAFAYYRRVVENQKNQILDEIIKVAELTNTPTDVIEALKAAKLEFQFTKAIESLKDAIPDALLLDGHSPLSLLHKALSEGLHQHTDEECLELANTIRIVLITLAERVGEILKDQSQLKQAISRLMNKK
jgi:hypothetical protein